MFRGTAILPARPKKPRDKAKVEAAVLLVQRWIIARLRNRQFFSREELNAAIRDEVARLNARVSRHLGASRQHLFETIERPAMQPLPPEPFVHADWRQATVGVDYHVRLEGHHYSVPHEPIRQQLWARLTAILVDVILRDRPHPEQGFRSCLGIRHPARSHSAERLEAACDRALVINARTMTSVKSILLNRLDGRRPVHPPEPPGTPAKPALRGGGAADHPRQQPRPSILPLNRRRRPC